jgi:hypothetical protein
MGRQVSLRELFGKRREEDAAWSVHNHHSDGAGTPGYQEGPPPMKNEALEILFRSARGA